MTRRFRIGAMATSIVVATSVAYGVNAQMAHAASVVENTWSSPQATIQTYKIDCANMYMKFKVTAKTAIAVHFFGDDNSGGKLLASGATWTVTTDTRILDRGDNADILFFVRNKDNTKTLQEATLWSFQTSSCA